MRKIDELIKKYGTRGISLMIDSAAERCTVELKKQLHEVARELKDAFEEERLHPCKTW